VLLSWRLHFFEEIDRFKKQDKADKHCQHEEKSVEHGSFI
jgi:hypothetical protein